MGFNSGFKGVNGRHTLFKGVNGRHTLFQGAFVMGNAALHTVIESLLSGRPAP